MEGMISLRRVLVSVYHKDGLDGLLDVLHDAGAELWSTGGTYSHIKSLGYDVRRVEDVTGWPALFGGRVKTLHPKVMGGVLARRDVVEDVDEMGRYGVEPIDMVVVDLYPFEEDGTGNVELIDIGGVTMIRGAAKNFRDVAVVSCRDEYAMVERWLREQNGQTSLEQRRELAIKAFTLTSRYDTVIAERLKLKVNK